MLEWPLHRILSECSDKTWISLPEKLPNDRDRQSELHPVLEFQREPRKPFSIENPLLMIVFSQKDGIYQDMKICF
jgi:hypothetical protein